MGGGRYLQSKSMRLYSLNIKTDGHLLLLKIAWFLINISKNEVVSHAEQTCKFMQGLA